jgi:hypothetical protein
MVRLWRHERGGLYASDFPGGECRRMQKPTGMRYIPDSASARETG